MQLRGRHLPCVMAHTQMSAADITPNALAFGPPVFYCLGWMVRVYQPGGSAKFFEAD
jgi:hypothetical protein